QAIANVQTHLGELDELDLPQGAYDAIVTNNALHHVENVPALLERLAALLAPGGALLVGDVTAEDGSFHAPNVVPHNGFQPEDVASMLERAGLLVAATLAHHVIRKPCHDGVVRDFPQFLICAEKT
ncbi:MAG: methyltransferase domain-containing protein, partial [Humidesulfovibrio sp.]|nr:methyltransferase domain-containing protein [Humidesulfovibrio sp.]